ncbi:MAG: DUF3786 domain-containing protein [Ruminococcaceae bacterium]|nr:DUF3786 domain-containing protein [Oscillospiraceae bacterium]
MHNGGNMNNYEQAQELARLHFLRYDHRALIHRCGVREMGRYLVFPFLGAMTRIEKDTGYITSSFDDFKTCWPADFSEAMSVYDWLCDQNPGAQASGEYGPVSALSGVYTSGGGLPMSAGKLPKSIEENPEQFRQVMTALGGKPHPLGDMGYVLDIFPGLPMALKFYYSDEDFPAELRLLWDSHMLDFVRYETIYYIAGVLLRRVRQGLAS